MSTDEATYTDPDLRRRIKQELQASDKGDRKGHWSARKSQLLVQEYERQGGGYTSDVRDESQKHLQQWGEQHWQTSGGDADAQGPAGTRRYLPELAWELLSRSEREATDRKKQGAGDQHVANTEAAQQARKAVELLSMTAPRARKAVRAMDTRSQLQRAKKAEEQHGKARKTVLAAIDERLDAVGQH